MDKQQIEKRLEQIEQDTKLLHEQRKIEKDEKVLAQINIALDTLASERLNARKKLKK